MSIPVLAGPAAAVASVKALDAVTDAVVALLRQVEEGRPTMDTGPVDRAVSQAGDVLETHWLEIGPGAHDALTVALADVESAVQLGLQVASPSVTWREARELAASAARCRSRRSRGCGLVRRARASLPCRLTPRQE